MVLVASTVSSRPGVGSSSAGCVSGWGLAVGAVTTVVGVGCGAGVEPGAGYERRAGDGNAVGLPTSPVAGVALGWRLGRGGSRDELTTALMVGVAKLSAGAGVGVGGRIESESQPSMSPISITALATKLASDVNEALFTNSAAG